MATPFLDTFTEASNTNLEDHTPTGGTAWTLTGTAAAAIINATTDALRSRTTSASIYVCDDQGSSNQYVQARLKNLLSSIANSYVCCRLVDSSNFVGWRVVGTGSTGLRLSESVAGTVTDLHTFQGVDEVVYRVEVDGTTARIYADGVQNGTDKTVASSTETSQGLRIGSDQASDWIDEFEAGALSSSPTGTGSLTTAVTTASGTGSISHTGTGAATVGAITASGTGTVTSAGTVTGTGAVTVGAVTASGAGTLTHTGTGAVSVGATAVTGLGVITHTGTGSITVGNVTLSGTDSIGVTGTGAITVGAVTIEATGIGNIWNAVASASGSWSDAAASSGTWTDQTPASGSWT